MSARVHAQLRYHRAVDPNPYAPPLADLDDAPAAGKPKRLVDEAILCALRETRPWVVALGTLSLVFSAIAALGLVGSAVGALSMPGDTRQQSQAWSMLPILFPGAMALYPGLKLRAYGSAIAKLLRTKSRRDLEEALLHQKSFWKFSGISMITIIAFEVIGVAFLFLIR